MKPITGKYSPCVRCRSVHPAMEEVCDKCKSELMLFYHHAISWKLAWEIEKESENVRKLITVFR